MSALVIFGGQVSRGGKCPACCRCERHDFNSTRLSCGVYYIMAYAVLFQGLSGQNIYTGPVDSCLVKIRVDYPPDPPWEPS